MTRVVGKTLFIESTPEAVCELCGAEEELRPYGPNGENICFDCGMKDEAAATKAFAKILAQVDTVVDNRKKIEE